MRNTDSPPPAIHLEGITRTHYSGDSNLTVLSGVDLDIPRGQKLAIVGPSGSGKTTLLGLCAGLDLPTTGKTSLLGTDITALDEDGRAAFRADNVGFIFQNFQLIPSLTALENVTAPLELRGETGAEEAARELLNKVGLAERIHHYPIQLSGGEQQRVALARAFINQPKILFADEPTGNLDGSNGQHTVDLLFGLNHVQGTTLVLVTHNPQLAEHCDRTVSIQNGKIIRDSAQS